MLSADAFNQMLGDMSQVAKWRRAYDCPCRDDHSGAARPDCPRCHGKGVTWTAPVLGWVAIAGQKVQQAWSRMDMYESGDMVMTLPSDSPLYGLGENDRIVMAQSSVPFSRVLTRGDGDRLPFEVEKIDRVYWLVNDAEVEGGIPSVSAQGELTWISGAPDPGVKYSVTGRRRPEYYLFKDYPQDRAHYGGQPLPRRVVARLMDLFGR